MLRTRIKKKPSGGASPMAARRAIGPSAGAAPGHAIEARACRHLVQGAWGAHLRATGNSRATHDTRRLRARNQHCWVLRTVLWQPEQRPT
jgi:hypothetical protein